MKDILVYADSMSWGIIPDTRARFAFHERWPGAMEQALIQKGHAVRIHENCLNGRRTAWSDPFRAGRDGSEGLAQVIEMHSPLALVIILLGTNDFQCTHQNSAWLSAQGIAKLIQIIRTAPVEPGMPIPEILVVCPPRIIAPKGIIAGKFEDATKRYDNLPEILSSLCQQLNVHYVDANHVIQSSRVDGIHLDLEDHLILAQFLADHLINSKLL